MSDRLPLNSSQSSSSKEQGNAGKKIRLERLTVQNFKALDSLDIDLPVPTMKADPDVFVLGSKNGLGKTSFLEACSIVFLVTILSHKTSSFSFNIGIRDYMKLLFDLPDMLIRADAKYAELRGVFSIDQKVTAKIKVILERNGNVLIEGDRSSFDKVIPRVEQTSKYIREAVSRFAYR